MPLLAPVITTTWFNLLLMMGGLSFFDLFGECYGSLRGVRTLSTSILRTTPTPCAPMVVADFDARLKKKRTA